MGILDFLSKKSPAAPAPAGATETTAAPADALKAEIVNHGLDASRINIAVDGSTVTLTGGAATTADAEKIALAVGNTKGVTKVVNNIAADAPHQDSGFYTVKSGDTLWKIAEESYGHGQGAKYQQIFEANRPLLKNADSIFPGQVLRIPGAAAPQASAAAAQEGRRHRSGRRPRPRFRNTSDAPASLRAKRSNPGVARASWIAASPWPAPRAACGSSR